MGGPQTQSRRRGEEKILDPTGTRNPARSEGYTDNAIRAPLANGV
jgi:hypothetical protein